MLLLLVLLLPLLRWALLRWVLCRRRVVCCCCCWRWVVCCGCCCRGVGYAAAAAAAAGWSAAAAGAAAAAAVLRWALQMLGVLQLLGGPAHRAQGGVEPRGGGGERVTRAYTVEVQTASVFYSRRVLSSCSLSL